MINAKKYVLQILFTMLIFYTVITASQGNKLG